MLKAKKMVDYFIIKMCNSVFLSKISCIKAS